MLPHLNLKEPPGWEVILIAVIVVSAIIALGLLDTLTVMSSTTDQDLEWDIILVVGEDQVRVSASSQILCIASEPFSKMLGPNFKEGQCDDASTGKEIPLPADKPSAVETMCSIIHHRIDGAIPAPTAANLCDLAIVSDKYDCTRATGLAARAWIQPTSAHNTNDLGLLLISASIYALPEAFYNISASLVLGHQGSYQELVKVPGFIEHLGWEIIRKWVSLVHWDWRANSNVK
jgi:hypothetical protein